MVFSFRCGTQHSLFMVFYLICFRCMCTAVAKNVEVWSNSITMWTMKCLSTCRSSTSMFIASWKTCGWAQRSALPPQSPRPLMCPEGTSCYSCLNDECWPFEWKNTPIITLLRHCRSPETVDMDEIMAAMVLTSLSCSPVIQHSAPGSATQG